MAQKAYDPHSGCSTLQTTFVSAANAEQRRGRAGRVCPGLCFRLFSTDRFRAMPPYQVRPLSPRRSSLPALPASPPLWGEALVGHHNHPHALTPSLPALPGP